jgi:hypothetical protein
MGGAHVTHRNAIFGEVAADPFGKFRPFVHSRPKAGYRIDQDPAAAHSLGPPIILIVINAAAIMTAIMLQPLGAKATAPVDWHAEFQPFACLTNLNSGASGNRSDAFVPLATDQQGEVDRLGQQ